MVTMGRFHAEAKALTQSDTVCPQFGLSGGVKGTSELEVRAAKESPIPQTLVKND